MAGLDQHIAQLGEGSLALALAVAVVLGLRHATDPDHLTAVATPIVGDERHGRRRARRLGLAWGLGHGAALFAFGLPVVLVGRALPGGLQQGVELAIGGLVCVLAARLLWRWHAGAFHSHARDHGGRRHARSPVAEHGTHDHFPAHAERLGGATTAAFAVGLVHGIGGSAGAGILVVGAAADGAPAAVALGLFATATAASMAFVSAVFGHALAPRTLAVRLDDVIPAMGAASLLFGFWYAAGAVGAAPYPL